MMVCISHSTTHLFFLDSDKKATIDEEDRVALWAERAGRPRAQRCLRDEMGGAGLLVARNAGVGGAFVGMLCGGSVSIGTHTYTPLR